MGQTSENECVVTITEAASENTPVKKKRGRPWVYDHHRIRDHLRARFPEVQSTRHHDNLVWRQRAIAFLKDDLEFQWLCDFKAIAAGAGRRFWKPGILVELWRIQDIEDMKRVARIIVAKKPKTKEAVAMIRQWRLGEKSEGDALTLMSALAKCLDSYVSTHLVTEQQIVVAVENLLSLVREFHAGETES
jgi:hypothetical protein